MSTDTKPVAEIVWSLADWPDDSVLTDTVIEESRKSRVELVAAMERCRAARAER